MSLLFDKNTLKELRSLPLAEEEKDIIYSKELFEDQHTSELWTCAICQNVIVKDPVLLVPCGHHFCRDHIFQHFHTQDKRSCPYDRSYVEAVLDNLPQVKEMLKNLTVYCPKKVFGSAPCKWKGKLENLMSHLEDECEFVKVKCKCGTVIPRSEAHLDHNCKCIRSACLYCGSSVAYRLIRAHEKACKDSEVTHTCGKKVQRRNLRTHERICENNYVECKYKIIGCKEKLHRQDVEVHYSVKEGYHFQLLQEYANSTQKRISELEAELSNKITTNVKMDLPPLETAKPVAFFLNYIKNLKNEQIKNASELKFKHLEASSQDLLCLGPHLLNNGSIYIGQWKEGLQQGKGVSFYPDGSIYEGYWENGVPNGEGRFLRENGDMYEGGIRNGSAFGQGKYFHHNGGVYEGQFVDNEKNGQGVERFPDSSKYEGSFQKGERDGKGVFENSKIRYEGDFVSGKMQGKGVCKLKDGGIYKGNFYDNVFNGYGDYTWADGRRYQGEWRGGLQHGKGIYYDENGTLYEGEWKEGRVLSWAIKPQPKIDFLAKRASIAGK